jgi:hypothetical protein
MADAYRETVVILTPDKNNPVLFHEKWYGFGTLQQLLERGWVVVGVTELNFGVLINLSQGIPPQ